MSAKNIALPASLSNHGLKWEGGFLARVALGWRAVFLVVGGDTLRERVAMDSENFGRICKVFAMASERLFDVDLLKLGDGLIQKDLPV